MTVADHDMVSVRRDDLRMILRHNHNWGEPHSPLAATWDRFRSAVAHRRKTFEELHDGCDSDPCPDCEA